MEAEKNLQIALGKKLRRLREARGLSQQKLARLAGMVQPMINRFETGERKMSSDHAMKLAPPLNIVPGAEGPSVRKSTLAYWTQC